MKLVTHFMSVFSHFKVALLSTSCNAHSHMEPICASHRIVQDSQHRNIAYH